MRASFVAITTLGFEIFGPFSRTGHTASHIAAGRGTRECDPRKIGAEKTKPEGSYRDETPDSRGTVVQGPGAPRRRHHVRPGGEVAGVALLLREEDDGAVRRTAKRLTSGNPFG